LEDFPVEEEERTVIHDLTRHVALGWNLKLQVPVPIGPKKFPTTKKSSLFNLRPCSTSLQILLV
jgi:hypothetical protein